MTLRVPLIIFSVLFSMNAFAFTEDSQADYVQPKPSESSPGYEIDSLYGPGGEMGELAPDFIQQIKEENERRRKNKLSEKKEDAFDKLSPAEFLRALNRFTQEGKPTTKQARSKSKRQRLSKPKKIEIYSEANRLKTGQSLSGEIDIFGDPVVHSVPAHKEQKKVRKTKKKQPRLAKKSEKLKKKETHTKKIVKDKIKVKKAAPASRLNALIVEELRQAKLPISEKNHPSTAIEILFSGGALDSSKISSSAPGERYRYLSVQMDWIPEILNGRAGILSFGGKISFYPTTDIQSVKAKTLTDWAIGSQVRYQLRLVSEQALVPILAYHFDIRSHFASSIQNKTTLLQHGPTLGAWFLLNVVDPELSKSFYRNVGVTRTYFTFEWRRRYARNSVARLDQTELEFGLRFEF